MNINTFKILTGSHILLVIIFWSIMIWLGYEIIIMIEDIGLKGIIDQIWNGNN